MRRTWMAGIWTLLVAISCWVFLASSRTEAAMQAAVSVTRVDDVPRIKLYGTTPDVVAGRETELDPTEPTLDLYLPPAEKATGAGVLILPGGGYQMLTVPGEGAEPARFFLSRNVAAFVLRYRHGPRYHYPTTLLDANLSSVSQAGNGSGSTIPSSRVEPCGFCGHEPSGASPAMP